MSKFPDLNWSLALLGSGLRLVTIHRPYTPTVAFKAFIRAGSRYDPHQSGVAHLVEHLLFAGTRTRTGWEIFDAVERVGGDIGGHTHKEYASMWTVVPFRDWSRGLEVLADLLCHPRLEEGPFLKEKQVVLEEMLAAQDKQTVLGELFVQTLWQAHPLRYSVRGTLLGLMNLVYPDLVAFYRGRYVAGNTILVACGDLDQDQVLRQVEALFSDLPPGSEQGPDSFEAEPPLEKCRTAHLAKDLHQTYLLMGVPTVPMSHPARSSLKVIERILGMGGSARLYQRLRNEESLAYIFHAFNVDYEDAGYFGINVVCNPAYLEQVEAIVLEEWEKLGASQVSESELAAAKGNYCGSLARSFETNLAVAGIFGVEALLSRIEPLTESITRIQAVDADQVCEVARRYLTPERYVRVTVGPERETLEPSS